MASTYGHVCGGEASCHKVKNVTFEDKSVELFVAGSPVYIPIRLKKYIFHVGSLLGKNNKRGGKRGEAVWTCLSLGAHSKRDLISRKTTAYYGKRGPARLGPQAHVSVS